ncbi:MAG: hypothetical protein Q8L97_06090 [Nitrosomonas sp.]|uniref:hypothetical protein n=1 Tax=Nitrosomonas sp. TaxID=42353 RepID=UPI00273125AB|nr:hypothetical protein [Nitrosomonas sp.]MDP1549715.1 hypothetical protein [Nitrosomonas sp.]
MHICPVCNQAGISSWVKFRSSTFMPAICEKCGARVYINSKINGLFAVATNIGLLFSAWIAFTQWSWLPLIIFVVVWIVLELMIVKFAPLVPKK